MTKKQDTLDNLYEVSKIYYESFLDTIKKSSKEDIDEVYEFNSLMITGTFIRDMSEQKRFENVDFKQDANLVYITIID